MPLIVYNNGRAQVQDVTGVRIQSRNMAAPQRAVKTKSRSSSVAPGLPKPFSLWPHRPRPCSCVPERPRPSSAPRAQMHLGKYAQMAGVGSTCSSHRLEISCSQVRVKKEPDAGVKLPVKHAMFRNAIQVKPQPKKRPMMTLVARKMMIIYQAKKRARPCPPPHPPPLHKLPVLKNMHFPKAAIPPKQVTLACDDDGIDHAAHDVVDACHNAGLECEKRAEHKDKSAERISPYVIGISGPSGAGKSTLAYALADRIAGPCKVHRATHSTAVWHYIAIDPNSKRPRVSIVAQDQFWRWSTAS